MLTTKLIAYLEAYLPPRALTLLSLIGFTLERIFLPKIQQVYLNASLDPHTLLPFIFSAIALYLSLVSIYHAIRASARLFWFGIKWSIVIIGIWFLLGAANEVGHNFGGLSSWTTSRPVSSSSSTWSNFKWKWPSQDSSPHQSSIFDPIKFYLSQGLISVFEPVNLFESFFSPVQPASTTYQPPSFEGPKTRSRPTSTSSRSTNQSPLQDQGYPAVQKMWEFVVQNVREPVVAMIREAKLKHEQRDQDSQTHNR